jgi:hypothetical protein
VLRREVCSGVSHHRDTATRMLYVTIQAYGGALFRSAVAVQYEQDTEYFSCECSQ